MKVKKARNDVILYGFMIVLSLIVYFWVIPSQIQMNAMAKAETFSPDTFPRFVTIIWILIAAVGEANALKTYYIVKKGGDFPRRRKKDTRIRYEEENSRESDPLCFFSPCSSLWYLI